MYRYFISFSYWDDDFGTCFSSGIININNLITNNNSLSEAVKLIEQGAISDIMYTDIVILIFQIMPS